MRKNNVGVFARGDEKRGGRPPSYLLRGITRCLTEAKPVCGNKLRRPVDSVDGAVLLVFPARMRNPNEVDMAR